jgi:hypothetical protein
MEDWTLFMKAFEECFKNPFYSFKQKRKLCQLHQDQMSLPIYITKFDAQATQTNILGLILIDFFVEGLNPEVARLLAGRPTRHPIQDL